MRLTCARGWVQNTLPLGTAGTSKERGDTETVVAVRRVPKKEAQMKRIGMVFLLAAVCCGWLSVAAQAPTMSGQAQEIGGVRHVLGLDTVKRDAKGTASVDSTKLSFVAGKSRAEIPLASVQDVFTGDDSQRVVRGTLQALSMFAPYGGGRFLSLFRSKVDLLTIEYRDANGALHGVVLTLPEGKAAVVKKQMVEHGAKTSIPVEEEEKRKEEKKEGKKP